MIIFNNEKNEENVSNDTVIETDEIEIDIAQKGNSVESIIEAAEESEEEEKTSHENAELDEKIEELLTAEFSKAHITKFHKGNLRSGASMEFDGSIVILGDVNPGAQVRATGNILVLGALKGVAHAGALGELQAYVFALNMNPVQLRIGDIITRFPETGRNKNAIIPEFAYLEDGKVYVSTFE